MRRRIVYNNDNNNKSFIERRNYVYIIYSTALQELLDAILLHNAI